MIGVVLPSSPLDAKKIEGLKKGEFILPKNLEANADFLAGEDHLRAEAFMEIWLNPKVEYVWCARGGYGAMRLLPLLDFHLLLKHPKPFIGMSDVTALHSAFNNLGLPTFLGPNICTLLDETPKELGYQLYPIVPGELKGKCVGGCLSLIVALLGTPWQLELDGKILVLEDVNEPPYKVDRMLTQLKLSGCLENLAGVVLGDLDADEFFKGSPYPVYGGLPSGHIDDQIIVPLEVETYCTKENVLVNPAGVFL